MLFNSLKFALFLPVVFAVYWLLRGSLRWQNLFVVAASYFFYACWDARFLCLIAGVSAMAWASGLLLGSTRRQAARRAVLWANVALNLGVLALFKYHDFFAAELARLLGLPPERWVLGLVLPVGISFYTFQALSYTVDVYRRTVQPTRDAAAFFAYVSFFPQLVAGPIERADSLLPQFLKPRSFNREAAVQGLRLMLWGMFKKVVVADRCALYVDAVFADPSRFGGGTLAAAAVLFAIQIYADFSGYSDLAIGCARLFGIGLRRNFATPYFATGMADFWRRWHMSLTSWLRDYVYLPLGGSRRGRWRTVANTFVVFLLSGLWHGAGWTFVLWGLYHAVLFTPGLLTGRRQRREASARTLPLCVLTFLLATAGWVIFRSPSTGFALHYFAGLAHGGEWLATGWHAPLAAAAMMAVEWAGRHRADGLPALPRSRAARWALYCLLLFIILTLQPTGEMPFIYFQF